MGIEHCALTPLGLYIHVPFCAAICNYCNFNRGLFDADLKEKYVAALLQEIRGAAEPGASVDTIFFGGGTPSLLEPAEIASLIAACRAAFSVAPDVEVTMEANPETVTPERLELFRAGGVNRLSYGVQSFRDEELRRLSRLHSAARARDAMAMARVAGFDNVSLDLMMWLPQQTVAEWLESVDALIALRPDHASLYLLELYPNAPLRDEMARARWSLAPDDDAADMYVNAMNRLEQQLPAGELERIVNAIAERRVDPYTAVRELLNRTFNTADGPDRPARHDHSKGTPGTL